MLEVETKFELSDRENLIAQLEQIHAKRGSVEDHADTYYRHPCRDFVQTNEALRVRSINGVASVTYKGPKLDVGDSALKARKEIEWCLAPGDSDGQQMEQLFLALGFTAVTTVRKQRISYAWADDDAAYSDFTLTVDDVEKVGLFAEIELLIPDDSASDVQSAGDRITELANRLGLTKTVRESYLQLLLDRIG